MVDDSTLWVLHILEMYRMRSFLHKQIPPSHQETQAEKNNIWQTQKKDPDLIWTTKIVFPAGDILKHLIKRIVSFFSCTPKYLLLSCEE